MAKGSRIVPVRIEDDMYASMEKLIASRNKNTQEEPWSMSSFIRYCIRAKMLHNARGKKAQGKKRKGCTPGMAVAS